MGLHGGGLGWGQVRLEPRIACQIRIEVGGADGVQDGQRGDDKNAMRCGEFAEIRGRRRPGKQVRQTVGARVDGVQRLLQATDVHHHQLAPFVRRVGQRLHDLFGERRARLSDPIFEHVIVDDLDVIRALGDPRVHP